MKPIFQTRIEFIPHTIPYYGDITKNALNSVKSEYFSYI